MKQPTMNDFISARRQNTRQAGFWTAVNNDSDLDKADLENQESQTPEVLDNINVDDNTEKLSESVDTLLQNSIPALLHQSPFLELPKPKKQRRETLWIYTHFHYTTLEKKRTFLITK